MAEADQLCERFAFIHKGVLRFLGTPKEFKSAVTVHEIIEVDSTSQSIIDQLKTLQGVRNMVEEEEILSSSVDWAERILGGILMPPFLTPRPQTSFPPSRG